jgi:hypothetical protein
MDRSKGSRRIPNMHRQLPARLYHFTKLGILVSGSETFRNLKSTCFSLNITFHVIILDNLLLTLGKGWNRQDGLFWTFIGNFGAVDFVRTVGAVFVSVALPCLEDALPICTAELPVLALVRIAILLVFTAGTITEELRQC